VNKEDIIPVEDNSFKRVLSKVRKSSQKDKNQLNEKENKDEENKDDTL
jgi:hypothetical protein